MTARDRRPGAPDQLAAALRAGRFTDPDEAAGGPEDGPAPAGGRAPGACRGAAPRPSGCPPSRVPARSRRPPPAARSPQRQRGPRPVRPARPAGARGARPCLAGRPRVATGRTVRPRAEDNPGQAPFGPAAWREAAGHARAGRLRAPDRRAGRSPRPRYDAGLSRQGRAGPARTTRRVPRAAPGSPHPQGCRHGSRGGRRTRCGRPARGGPDPGAARPGGGRGGQRVGLRGGQSVVSQRIPGRLVVRAVGPVGGVRRGAACPSRRDGRPGLPPRAAVGTAIPAGTRAQQTPRAPPLFLGAPVRAPAPRILRARPRQRPGAARSSPPRWPGDRGPDRAHPPRRARLPPAGRAALPAGEPRRMDWARGAGTARSRRPHARRPAPRPP